VFSNGEVNSNRFPLMTNFVDIMAWGTERAAWFVAREAEIAEYRRQLMELEAPTLAEERGVE
jgi:hypothetical protein